MSEGAPVPQHPSMMAPPPPGIAPPPSDSNLYPALGFEAVHPTSPPPPPPPQHPSEYSMNTSLAVSHHN